MRAPALLVVGAFFSTLALPASIDAQVRVARPRPVVASRPVAVARPTVYARSYYYPPVYRSSVFVGFGYPGFYAGYGYSPFYAGWAYPAYYGGWGYPAFYPASYYQWPGYYGPYGGATIRLQIAQRDAEVFVDGYYAGTVDQFDGTFERLDAEPGEHELQVYLPGHRLFQQRVYLQPGKTFNVKHTMEPVAANEAAPARPQGAALPPRPRNEIATVGPRPQEAGRGRQGAPAEPAARAFGSLSLRVQPADAEVLIDGERWVGSLEDNQLLLQLGAGVHNLEIRRAGYRSYHTDIALGAGQTKTLNVALTKQ